MSRFVRSLAGAIAPSRAIAQSFAAQHDVDQSIPTIGALLTGVRATDVGSVLEGPDSTASSSSGAQRAAIQDEATIEARRSQFLTTGDVSRTRAPA